MDVTSIAKLSTTLSETRQSQEIGTTMLKKTLDLGKISTNMVAAVNPKITIPRLPHASSR